MFGSTNEAKKGKYFRGTAHRLGDYEKDSERVEPDPMEPEEPGGGPVKCNSKLLLISLDGTVSRGVIMAASVCLM